MKEIKFRAWDEQQKIMHLDFEFISSGQEQNDWIIFKSDKQQLKDKVVFDNPYFYKQFKIMQFTGLKDKNGIDIYEGDIVRVNKLTYDKNNEFESFVSKIEFYMGSFHLDVKKMLLLPYGKDIEVIGNIYENPELLNVNIGAK